VNLPTPLLMMKASRIDEPLYQSSKQLNVKDFFAVNQ